MEVATGQVHAIGGVYILKAGNSASVEGYLRCGGYLDILDIVGVSVEFEVGLGYFDALPGRPIKGSATVTVGIHVLSFNESVSFGVTKSFKTVDRADAVEESGDPDAWDSYCTAFVWNTGTILTTQQIHWLVCPTGLDDAGTAPRLSVVVLPQLSTDGPVTELSAFEPSIGRPPCPPLPSGSTCCFQRGP